MQPAVFAKNHRGHLEAAVQISRADSAQLISFRSSRRWASAHRLLEKSAGASLPILFGVVDEGPEVLYGGRLREVILGPNQSDERAKELLEFRPHTTVTENWWSNSVKTIYAVSGLRELEERIPYSNLLKQSDDTPLSAAFKYSYALVTVADSDVVVCSRGAADLASPPTRIDVVVSRVIRDTALTRRLKSLHDDRCQLCDTRLEFPAGEGYSEAHHLQPLGRPHNGPDMGANILVVCPNCHARCDHGAVTLVRSDIRTIDGHDIGEEFITYHNRNIRVRETG